MESDLTDQIEKAMTIEWKKYSIGNNAWPTLGEKREERTLYKPVSMGGEALARN